MPHPSPSLLNDFSFTFGSSAYFAVILPVTSGLALVPPEPDLPQPSPGIAGDIKRLLPLEFGSTRLETSISFYVWKSTLKPNLTARWHFSLFPPFLTLERPELFEVTPESQTKMDIGISLPNLLIFLFKWTSIWMCFERECPFLFLLWGWALIFLSYLAIFYTFKLLDYIAERMGYISLEEEIPFCPFR